METDIAYEVVEIRARLRDVAGLYWSKFLNYREAEFSLKQFDNARDFHGPVVANIIDFQGAVLAAGSVSSCGYCAGKGMRSRSRTTVSVTSST